LRDRLHPEPDPDWPGREARWRRKLRRLRLGAEPVEEQVARLRRVTVALTVVLAAIGILFLAIFAAFGRPDVGAAVVAVLLGPVVGWAWLDQALLGSRAAAYLRDRAAHASNETPPG
jgi:hypothetical protein